MKHSPAGQSRAPRARATRQLILVFGCLPIVLLQPLFFGGGTTPREPGADGHQISVVGKGKTVPDRAARYSIDLVSDHDGQVHLFSGALGWRAQDDPAVSSIIRHQVLLGDSWTFRDDVPTLTCGVSAFRADSAASSDVIDLTIATNADCSAVVREALVTLELAGEEWGEPRQVSDDAAIPTIAAGDQMALIRNRDSLHGFWIDWRDENVVSSVITGEGQRARIYHRNLTASRNGPRRVQRRGRFDVTSFAAVSVLSGGIHIFWPRIGRKTQLRHSSLVGGEWSKKPVVIDDGHTEGSGIRILSIDAVSHGNEVWLAWNRAYWADKSTREYVGVIGRFRDGALSGQPIIFSHRARNLKWVTAGGIPVGILAQEVAENDRSLSPTALELAFYPLRGQRIGPRVQVAGAESMSLAYDGLVANDEVHVVFARPEANNKVTILHSRFPLQR